MMMEMKWKVPAETSCDNSSGQKVIAVPSCVPAPPIPSYIPCSQNSLVAGEVPIPYVPAPTCSKCGNTLGCVSCYNETHAPAERTFTAEQWEKAVADEAASQQMSLPSAFIPNLRFRLTAPKPKTPEEIVQGFICNDRNKMCSDKCPREVAEMIVAELAKERP
jgi:hypothetical protein